MGVSGSKGGSVAAVMLSRASSIRVKQTPAFWGSNNSVLEHGISAAVSVSHVLLTLARRFLLPGRVLLSEGAAKLVCASAVEMTAVKVVILEIELGIA